jgi:hypothetical protein
MLNDESTARIAMILPFFDEVVARNFELFAWCRDRQFLVTPRPPPQAVVEADISREPTDLPPPIKRRDP